MELTKYELLETEVEGVSTYGVQAVVPASEEQGIAGPLCFADVSFDRNAVKALVEALNRENLPLEQFGYVVQEFVDRAATLAY